MTTQKINPISVKAAAAGAAMEAKLKAERELAIAAVQAQGLESRANAEAAAERVKNFDAKRAGQSKQLWPALSEDANTALAPKFAEPAPGLNAVELAAAQAVIGLMNNETNRAIVLHNLNPLPISDVYFCDNNDIGSGEMRHRTEIIKHAAKTPAGLSVTEHLNRILIAVEQTPTRAKVAPVAVVKLTPAADKVAKLQTALAGKYRPLQATLKAMRDAQELPNTIRVNVSHADLKVIASNLLNTWLIKAAEFEKQCNTLEAKRDAVKAQLDSAIITNNCDFSGRINDGTRMEKTWLSKRNESKISLMNQAGVYITYAGDALTLIALTGIAPTIRRGVLAAAIPASEITDFTDRCNALGIPLHYM